MSGSAFWGYVIICTLLVLGAGLMSGLTLGLLSLDLRELEILARVGDERERRLAPRLIPVCKKHHWVLVTLLLGNASVLEALPIFLDRLVPSEVAIIISVTAVLFFGEIIPMALCSRYGLEIGANLAWLVTFLLWASSPISWPIAKFLDCILGSNHVTFYRKAHLKEFLSLHSQSGGPLTTDEMTIMQGALDLREKTVGDAMVPIEHVYMLDSSSIFNAELLLDIRARGHSRIPVFHEQPQNVLGIMLVKSLIGLNPADNTSLHNIRLRQPPRLSADTPLFECLDLMQTGQSHMALVVKGKNFKASVAKKETTSRVGELLVSASNLSIDAMEERENAPVVASEADASSSNATTLSRLPAEADEIIGIITLEDIVEELIGEEIVDETDEYEDVTKKNKRVALASLDLLRQSNVDRAVSRGTAATRMSGLFQRSRGNSQSGSSGTGVPSRGPSVSSSRHAHHANTGAIEERSSDAGSSQGDREPLL